MATVSIPIEIVGSSGKPLVDQLRECVALAKELHEIRKEKAPEYKVLTEETIRYIDDNLVAVAHYPEGGEKFYPRNIFTIDGKDVFVVVTDDLNKMR